MDIHIGKEIERKYEQSGMKLSEFAKRINTSPRNVYSIFARKEIKTDQLLKIGEVLRFNFFSLYDDVSPSHATDSNSSSLQKAAQRIVITVELDGEQSTLEHHLKRISAINQLLKAK